MLTATGQLCLGGLRMSSYQVLPGSPGNGELNDRIN